MTSFSSSIVFPTNLFSLVSASLKTFPKSTILAVASGKPEMPAFLVAIISLLYCKSDVFEYAGIRAPESGSLSIFIPAIPEAPRPLAIEREISNLWSSLLAAESSLNNLIASASLSFISFCFSAADSVIEL